MTPEQPLISGRYNSLTGLNSKISSIYINLFGLYSDLSCPYSSSSGLETAISDPILTCQAYIANIRPLPLVCLVDSYAYTITSAHPIASLLKPNSNLTFIYGCISSICTYYCRLITIYSNLMTSSWRRLCPFNETYYTPYSDLSCIYSCHASIDVRPI